MVALQPVNLFYCFIGCVAGTLVGVLPGIGPTSAVALLLPTTFHMTPISAIIMLSGIAYGSAYGGSTTSILVNVPGESCSVVTCLDGYQMARRGRAGAALGIAAFGSFIAGTIGVVGLMLLAPPLAEAALKFGPPEYFALMILGLTILTFSGATLTADSNSCWSCASVGASFAWATGMADTNKPIIRATTVFFIGYLCRIIVITAF